MDNCEKEKLINAFVDECLNVVSTTVHILLANGFDLIELDMSNFSPKIFFIPNPTIERGKMILIKDPELNRNLYKFCIKNKDRVFQGTKGAINTEDIKEG